MVQNRFRLAIQASKDMAKLECPKAAKLEETISKFEQLRRLVPGRQISDDMDVLRRITRGIPECQVVMQAHLMLPVNLMTVDGVLADLKRVVPDMKWDNRGKHTTTGAGVVGYMGEKGEKGKGKGKGKGKKGKQHANAAWDASGGGGGGGPGAGAGCTAYPGDTLSLIHI